MKKTNCFATLLISCYIIPSIALAETASIIPSEIASPRIGQKVTINVQIEGAINLFGFEFDLSYNPIFLKFVGAIEGDFLKAGGTTFVISPIVYGAKPKDGGAGTIRMGVSRLGGEAAKGGGVLATVEFEIIKEVSEPNLIEFKKFSLFDTQASKKAPAKMIGGKVIPSQSLAPWDINGDGQVDINDLVLVGRHFGKTIKEPVSPNSDVNRDGIVDISDLALISIHFAEIAETPLMAQ